MNCSFIKTKLTAAIFVVLMVSSVTLMVMPVLAQTNEQDPGSLLLPAGVTPDVQYNTIAHMSFRPNPIGVGQPLLVNVWMQPPLWAGRYFNNAFKVTFTKPDGTTDSKTFSSYQGDATGWFEYIVDKVGTWQVKFDFLGAYYPAGNYTPAEAVFAGSTLNALESIYYAPSSDGPYDVEVQSELALSWPPSPLPTDYWTTPVEPENREWWPILGSVPSPGIVGGGPTWPADTNTYMSNYNYVPYVTSPESPHIVWKQMQDIGGLIGSALGQYDYVLDFGLNTFNIIYQGMGYRTIIKPTGTTTTTYWQCCDLYTGDVVWERPLEPGEPTPSMVNYVTRTIEAVPGNTAQARGVIVQFMAISGGRLITWDPYDGHVQWNISISPLTSATFYANAESAPLFYSVQNLGGGNYRLINWSITGTPAYPDLLNRHVEVLNNVSWPFSSLGTVDYESSIAVSSQSIPASSTGVSYSQMIMAADMRTGTLLWNITTEASTVAHSGLGGFFSGSTQIADHGKYAVRLNDGHWHCWDLRTGSELWVGELTSWPWGTFGGYGVMSAYGLLYYPQYDGFAAYNWTTGKVAWRVEALAPYPYETQYQDYNPFYDTTVQISDGKLYATNYAHPPLNQPYSRGWKFFCINATSGEVIWSINGDMTSLKGAFGYMVAANRNDGYTYCFGKGKSAMTVTAPDTAVPLGTSLTIKGTVLDQSPAQPGTPCVSVESMETQMEYLHMQMPIDGVAHNLTITGVPVVLTAIGSDGTVIDLGTVTTNGYYGTFSKAWAPPKEDMYTVIAQYAGDASYGSSSAGTFVQVGPAPATPSTPEIPTPVDNTMLLYGILVAVVIAIIIGLVAILLVLRKH